MFDRFFSSSVPDASGDSTVEVGSRADSIEAPALAPGMVPLVKDPGAGSLPLGDEFGVIKNPVPNDAGEIVSEDYKCRG